MVPMTPIQAPIMWSEISDLLGERARMIKHHAVFDQIDSTNDWALQQCADSSALPVLCVAESQRRGRGRRGREWQSPSGRNVYMSLAMPFRRNLQDLGALSLVVGISLAQVLSVYAIEPALKWPNDVLVGGRKLAGVLIETRSMAGAVSPMVMGIGMNFNMRDMNMSAIDQPWTDFVSEYRGEAISRNRLIADILSRLMANCERYEAAGFDEFQTLWRVYDVCDGQLLNLVAGDRAFQGIGRGVDRNGAILVQLDAGVEAFHSAEVTVRPVP